MPHFKTLAICLLASLACQAQKFPEEGFYEIFAEASENTTTLLLRGDSAEVYFVAKQPVVGRSQVVSTVGNDHPTSLLFIYNDVAAARLKEFTSGHVGGLVGFVHLGSLRKVYMIEETIDNGVIDLMARSLRRVDRQ